MAVLGKQYPAIPEPRADVASLLQTVQAMKQVIDTLTGNVAKGDGLADVLRDIKSKQGGLSARFTEYIEVSTNGDKALAQRITTFEARYESDQEDVAAKFTEVEKAYADADKALAQRSTTLEAYFKDFNGGTVQARFQSIETAYADADSALAERIDIVEATANGGSASGKITFRAQAGPDGWSAMYSLVVRAGPNDGAGAKAGFDVLARVNADGSVSESAIRLTAANFLLYDPSRSSAEPVFNYADGVFTFNVPVVIKGEQLEKNAATNSDLRINPDSNAGSVSVPLNLRAGSIVDIFGEFDGQPTSGFPQVLAHLQVYRLSAVDPGNAVLLRDKPVSSWVLRINSTNTYYYSYTGISVRDVVPADGNYSYQLVMTAHPLGPLTIRGIEMFR